MEQLQQLLWYPLEDFPFIILTLMIAFTVHEFAHAYSAYKFGDPTAYKQGRVTLNPKEHLDVFGTLLLIIVGFGWAKPVPVNRGNFSNPRLMGIIVSAVGPLSNLLLMTIGLFLLHGDINLNWFDGLAPRVHEAFTRFFDYFIRINVMLFIFNLIPLPPLDGYRIAEDLAPLRIRLQMQQYEQWGIFIFLLLVFIPPLKAVTLTPLFSLQVPIVESVWNFFRSTL